MKNSVVEKTFSDESRGRAERCQRGGVFRGLLDMLLPYYCRGCGRTGMVLCEECRKEILPVAVLKSGMVVFQGVKMGKEMELGEVERLFVGGWREGTLKALVEDYKFKSVKRISEVLAEILEAGMPEEILKSREIVVVPLPTVRKHIRQRGFDHTKRLAEELARRRGWEMVEVLERVNKTVQVGADEETRLKQAEEAYAAKAELVRGDATYLLVDDVWTTGASMRAAAKKLRAAGAGRIMAVVVETGRPR